jgi:acetyltransferase-like isoleucine patch superfamily enzyme
MHKLLLLYTWFVRTILYFLPDQPVIMAFRGKLYSFAMKKCGNNFQVSSNTILRNLRKISVGNNVYLAPNVVVNAIDDIILEKDVMIGFNSVIVSGNHTRLNNSFRFGKSLKEKIIIKEGSWVGANCTVIAGSIIPPSSVLAANSCIKDKYVVSGVYAGNLAKLIKEFND